MMTLRSYGGPQMPEFVDRFVDRVGYEYGCNGRFDGIDPCHLCS